MESREIRDLIESYYSVYDQDLNEMAMPPKDYDKVKKPQPKPSVKRGGPMGEQSVFDIIKGHLLDEGYANTEQAALVIMANMSEDWKQSIVEAVGIVGPPKKAIDAIPGVRDLRIGLANIVKRSDYGLNDPVRKVGKHVVPTPRNKPYTNPDNYKDISGD